MKEDVWKLIGARILACAQWHVSFSMSVSPIDAKDAQAAYDLLEQLKRECEHVSIDGSVAAAWGLLGK